MKRLVIQAIVKICAESILLILITGIIIGILGYMNKWTSSIEYSNAFFLAGSLAIIAGGMSRFAAGQGWSTFQLLSTESLRHMSNSERANFILDANSPIRLVILGLLTGILLCVISMSVTKIF